MVVTGFSTTVRKTTLVDAAPAKVWKSISQITNLWWAAGVAKTVPLAGPRTGFGAGRIISFDANSVKEIITGWKKGEYLSYVALSGLGISAYHATISLKPVRGKTRITWESVFADKAAHQRFVICDMDFHTFAGAASTRVVLRTVVEKPVTTMAYNGMLCLYVLAARCFYYIRL